MSTAVADAHAALVVEDEGSHVLIWIPAKGASLLTEFVVVTIAI